MNINSSEFSCLKFLLLVNEKSFQLIFYWHQSQSENLLFQTCLNICDEKYIFPAEKACIHTNVRESVIWLSGKLEP